jgi:diguanylate cyclase (GGDEF)-like protein
MLDWPLFRACKTYYPCESLFSDLRVANRTTETTKTLLRQLSALLQDWVSSDAQQLAQQFAEFADSAAAAKLTGIDAIARAIHASLLLYVAKAPTEAAHKKIIDLGRKLKAMVLEAEHANAAPAPATAVATKPTARAPAQVIVLPVQANAYFLAELDAQLKSVDSKELTALLRQRGVALSVFYDGDQIAEALTQQQPDALICESAFVPALSEMLDNLDRDFPGISMRMPLVAINKLSNPTRRLMAGLGGADEYLEGASASEVADCLVSLLSAEGEEPYQILIVDDDRQQAMFCAGVLKRKGMEVTSALSADEAMQALATRRPDLVLMDLYMPGLNGLELTAILRQRSDSLVLPIVFLSGEQDTQVRFDALNIGGDDYLTKPIRPRHLATAVASRVKRVRALREQLAQARTETAQQGVYRRANFLELLAAQAKLAVSPVNALTLYYLSVDLRSQLIDSLGLMAQHALETEISERIGQILEQGDALTALGGFEYALLARRSSEERSAEFGERLRAAICQKACSVDGDEIALFASVGIAAQRDAKADAERWLTIAHMAMQRAERAGGNRCEQGLNEAAAPKPERARVLQSMLAEAPSRNNTNLLYLPVVPLRGAPLSQYQQELALRGETIATANVPRRDYYASAEKQSALARLDRYALSRAFEAVRESARLGGAVSLFIPCAAQALTDDLAQGLKQELAIAGNEARTLVLQFDLHELELEASAAAKRLKDLRAQGVRLCMSLDLPRPNLRALLGKHQPDFIAVHADLLRESALKAAPTLLPTLREFAQKGCKLIAQEVAKAEQLAALWQLEIDYFTSAQLGPARMQFDFAFSPFRPKPEAARASAA